MQIDPNSWHYKVYVFNTQLCRAWAAKDFYYEEPSVKNIGLCPYMRMILIWGPLVMLTYTLPLGAMFFTFGALPYTTAGGHAILFTIGGFVGTIAMIVGFFGALWYISDRNDKRKKRLREQELERKLNDLPEPATWWSLTTDWIKTHKTKICPVLEVKKND